MQRINLCKNIFATRIFYKNTTHLGGVMSHHSTLNPTGWFSRLLQTNHLGAIFALVFSITLTACGGGGEERTDIGPEPGPDGVAPTLVSVVMFNSFNESSEVKLGQTIQLDFQASESIMKPTVTIGGMAAEVTGQHNTWSATLTMDDETVEDGVLSLSIIFSDVSGEAGVTVTDVTEGELVTYCKDGCAADEEDQGIAGDWKLTPEAGAIGVGPGLGDTSWWANGAGDVDTRGCLFDDIYRFGADGSFTNVVGDTTWVEVWQGAAADGCAAPVAPHDGTAVATYTHDESASTITIDGLGAYLGLAKAFNGGELTNPADAKASIVYTITAMTDTTMTLDIEIAGGGYWRFKLTKIVPAAIAGDWKLAPEAGAIGVGPGLGDTSWWANGAGDVETRGCLFDDIYRFGADGSFTNVVGDTTWVEVWQGAAADGCAAAVAPHDGSASATYTYDESASTITVDGVGAYLGLAKAFNGGELTNPADAKASVVYTITAMTDDSMTLDIEIAGGGYWRFKLVRAVAEAAPAIAGDWKLTPEAGAMGVGPGLGDTSWWANGAGDVDTRGCLFDDIYRFGADGSFTNVLGDTTWVEVWQGATADGCAAPVAPHDGSAVATYTYDESALTITIDGLGAYLGLAKAYNGGELTNPANAVASIVYTITAMTDTTMTLDIEIAGGGYWRYKLTKQ
jgi:hypothetical protein